MPAAIVNAIAPAAKRYMIANNVAAPTSAGTIIAGLRKLNANPVCRIYSISVITANIAGAGVMAPVSIYRATSVANGFLTASNQIHRLDTNYALPTLEVRWDTIVTGTIANQRLLVLGGGPVTTTQAASQRSVWRARDINDAIVLRGDEGLLLVQELAGDVDTQSYIGYSWEEE